jgi:hypothetical protein
MEERVTSILDPRDKNGWHSLDSPGGNDKKPRKTSVRIAGLRAQI